MGPKPLRNRAMALAVTGRGAIAESRALSVDEAGESESERMETTTFRNNIMSDLDIMGIRICPNGQEPGVGVPFPSTLLPCLANQSALCVVRI